MTPEQQNYCEFIDKACEGYGKLLSEVKRLTEENSNLRKDNLSMVNGLEEENIKIQQLRAQCAQMRETLEKISEGNYDCIEPENCQASVIAKKYYCRNRVP